MEINYRLQHADLAAYRQAVVSRAAFVPRGLVARLVHFAVPIAAAAVTLLIAHAVWTVALGYPLSLPDFLVGLICGVIIAGISLAFGQRSASSRLVRSDGPTLAPHRLIILPDGVKISSPHFETLYRWAAVQAVTVEHGIIVLWLEPAVGIAIPRSAFASKAAERDLVAAIKSMLVSARLPRAGAFA